MGWDDVEPGFSAYIDLTCNTLRPTAFMQIYVVDDIEKNVLSAEDTGAEIPKCCDAPSDLPSGIVLYTIEINCVSKCAKKVKKKTISEEERHMMRGRA